MTTAVYEIKVRVRGPADAIFSPDVFCSGVVEAFEPKQGWHVGEVEINQVECSHSYVEHPCPSLNQAGKEYCELCGEPKP